MKDLVAALDHYVKLLSDELNEITMLAHVHGWRSTRSEEGKIVRADILRLKEQYVLVEPASTPILETQIPLFLDNSVITASDSVSV